MARSSSALRQPAGVRLGRPAEDLRAAALRRRRRKSLQPPSTSIVPPTPRSPSTPNAGVAAARSPMPPGATSRCARVTFDDGWQNIEDLPPFKTTVSIDATRRIITRNDSPDISFDRSINPYRGCEHGCIYCFARPTHAYLGLSPGSISNRSCSPSRTRRSCWSASCPIRSIRRARSRSAPTPIPISRSRSSIRSCGAFSKCSTTSAIRSASSPSRRWCCAISTSSRAWRSAISPRSRCR